MKVEDNSSTNIERIMESISCLHIDEIDKKLSDFINRNINYFYLENQFKLVTNHNKFEIINDDNSTFMVELSPSYVNLKHINIKLINLNGMLSQNYIIDYNNDGLTITYKRNYINNNSSNIKITKLFVESKYLNNKKRYEKKIENLIQSNDDCYTKETIIHYPNLDDNYLKSEVKIDTINSNIKYIKGNRFGSKNISLSEFENGINEKNKIKVKTKKCS